MRKEIGKKKGIKKRKQKNRNQIGSGKREVPTRFELVIKVLQTFALPLGYGTIPSSIEE